MYSQTIPEILLTTSGGVCAPSTAASAAHRQ